MKLNKKKNIKELMRSKSGFTLTELIVCFALLSVITLCVSIMLTAGSNFYSRVNKQVSGSYKSQLTMAQIKEFFIDAVGISQIDEEGVTKTYVASIESGVPVIYCVWFDSENSKILFNKRNIGEATGEVIESTITSDQPIATTVSSFVVALNTTKAMQLKGVKVDLEIKVGNMPYNQSQIITFRTNPVVGSGVADLAQKVWNNWKEDDAA